jgi:hypothetical protein
MVGAGCVVRSISWGRVPAGDEPEIRRHLARILRYRVLDIPLGHASTFWPEVTILIAVPLELKRPAWGVRLRPHR